MMISRSATKVHQPHIVYMGKPYRDAIYSSFWERKAIEHNIKSSQPEICRIKKNDISASTEIKRYQGRDEKEGAKESGERAYTSFGTLPA